MPMSDPVLAMKPTSDGTRLVSGRGDPFCWRRGETGCPPLASPTLPAAIGGGSALACKGAAGFQGAKRSATQLPLQLALPKRIVQVTVWLSGMPKPSW